MTPIPPRCVIDASVGIKLFIDEPLSDQAHELFECLTVDPLTVFYVPDLFFIECANILWKYSRRYGRALEDSQSDLADLGRLALRTVSTAELMEEAFNLAIQTGLTAYDACYAALAARLELPLVTADQELCKVFSRVIWLGDLERPNSMG